MLPFETKCLDLVVENYQPQSLIRNIMPRNIPPFFAEILSEKNFDVLIVGAGPAGTATAIALGNSGLSVCLLEKLSSPAIKPVATH